MGHGILNMRQLISIFAQLLSLACGTEYLWKYVSNKYVSNFGGIVVKNFEGSDILQYISINKIGKVFFYDFVEYGFCTFEVGLFAFFYTYYS
ncbi:hypothetical protein H671_xg20570 [Cricetulus griseus]|uniref:Uncharacterized protein n=1 Tax=Cricetulus griseus TaxID=10029 RepID=A0A061HUY3_CRIGR|nr:hypothetical protein H671_xg20570 [Cricetulus griseus]